MGTDGDSAGGDDRRRARHRQRARPVAAADVPAFPATRRGSVRATHTALGPPSLHGHGAPTAVAATPTTAAATAAAAADVAAERRPRACRRQPQPAAPPIGMTARAAAGVGKEHVSGTHKSRNCRSMPRYWVTECCNSHSVVLFINSLTKVTRQSATYSEK